jgi:hypothetical protein
MGQIQLIQHCFDKKLHSKYNNRLSYKLHTLRFSNYGINSLGFRRFVVRRERPIKLGDSRFFTKCIEVLRYQGMFEGSNKLNNGI